MSNQKRVKQEQITTIMDCIKRFTVKRKKLRRKLHDKFLRKNKVQYFYKGAKEDHKNPKLKSMNVEIR